MEKPDYWPKTRFCDGVSIFAFDSKLLLAPFYDNTVILFFQKQKSIDSSFVLIAVPVEFVSRRRICFLKKNLFPEEEFVAFIPKCSFLLETTKNIFSQLCNIPEPTTTNLLPISFISSHSQDTASTQCFSRSHSYPKPPPQCRSFFQQLSQFNYICTD